MEEGNMQTPVKASQSLANGTERPGLSMRTSQVISSGLNNLYWRILSIGMVSAKD